ncbi:MAG: hypothetical protein ACI87W_000527 [Halieaceae bacterium]|jgi:hypothetical protein
MAERSFWLFNGGQSWLKVAHIFEQRLTLSALLILGVAPLP